MRLRAKRFQAPFLRRGSAGSGHLYQGRFKSFAVQADEHPLAVWRDIERNPLRANLVRRAEDWRWSSLWRRRFGEAAARGLLTDGPLPLPAGWAARVDSAETAAELEALRRCVARGRPFGAEASVADVVRRLGLAITARPAGDRRKAPDTLSSWPLLTDFSTLQKGSRRSFPRFAVQVGLDNCNG